jgi:hypothetical protein
MIVERDIKKMYGLWLAMSAEQRRVFLKWASQNIDSKEIGEPPAPPSDTARAIEEAGGVEAFIQQMKVTAVTLGLSVKAAKDVLVAEYLDPLVAERQGVDETESITGAP